MDRETLIIVILMFIGLIMIGYYYIKETNYPLTIINKQPTADNSIVPQTNNTNNTSINQNEQLPVNNTNNTQENEEETEIVYSNNNYVLIKLSGEDHNIKIYTFSTSLYNYVIIKSDQSILISTTTGEKFVFNDNIVMIRYSKIKTKDDVTFKIGESEYLLRIKQMNFEKITITIGNMTYNDKIGVMFIPIKIQPEVPSGVIILKAELVIPKSTNIDIAISGSTGQILVYKPIVPFDMVQFKLEAKILIDKVMTTMITIPKDKFKPPETQVNQTEETQSKVIVSPIIVIVNDKYKYIFTYKGETYEYESSMDMDTITIDNITFEFTNKKYIDSTPFTTIHIDGNTISVHPVGFTRTITYYGKYGNIIGVDNITLGDIFLIMSQGKLVETNNASETIANILSGNEVAITNKIEPSQYIVILNDKFAYVNLTNVPDGIIGTMITTDEVHKQINAHKIVLPVGVNTITIHIYAKFDNTIYDIPIQKTIMIPAEYNITSIYGTVTINGVTHDIITGVTNSIDVISYALNNNGITSNYGDLTIYYVDVTGRPITNHELNAAINKGPQFDININIEINNKMVIYVSTSTPIRIVVIGANNIQTQSETEYGNNYAIITTNKETTIEIPSEEIESITDIYILKYSDYEPIIDTVFIPNNLIYYHIVFST